MIFTSLPFCIFVAATLIVYWSVPANFRWLILLLASGIYYWSFSKWLIIHAIISSAIVYESTALIGRKRKEAIEQISHVDSLEEKKVIRKKSKREQKTITVICAILLIASWIIFKFMDQIVLWSKSTALIKYVTPVGISFYSFSLLAYLIDMYNSNVDFENNYLHVLSYTLFFPAIVQGPINRYQSLGKEINAIKPFDYDLFKAGIVKIIWGYYKKMVIADRLFAVTSVCFDKNHTGIVLLICAMLTRIHLYADFSGGIDIAIGVANLFGISMAANFKRPLLSKSVSEFWRRWHITLGDWLRDYVFYPITLSTLMNKLSKSLRKKSKYLSRMAPAIVAMFVLWSCSALWHGDKTSYALWGLYFWAWVTADTIFDKKIESFTSSLSQNMRKAVSVIRWAVTFLIVSIGEMISTSPSWAVAIHRVGDLFVYGESKISDLLSYGLDAKDWGVAVISIMVLFFVEIMFQMMNIDDGFAVVSSKPLIIRWIILYVLIFVTLIFGYYGPGYDPTPFVYFQF